MAKQNGTPKKPSASEEKPECLPAYFLSLTLENVRCFGPKQTLNLSTKEGKPAPWTIILGLNGTGKTTLLQSLAGFERVPDTKLITQYENAPSWVRLGARAMVYHRNDDPHFCRDKTRSVVFNARFAISDNLSNSVSKFGEGQLELSVGSAHYRGSVCSPQCFGYGASRRLGSVSLTENEDDPTATLFSDRAELRNAEEWLLQLDYATKSNNKDAEHRLAQAKQLLLSIMPEDEITDIHFTTSGGVNPKARAEFQTPYGWVPLRQLGYGYQTLITWVADLVSRMAERYPDSKNPLEEPAVVLVDEIDLHLHPKWQRKLIKFLSDRFKKTQFIATAHSPLVVQAAEDANIAVLRREGDHVVIDNEVENIRNWRIDQILTSDLFGLETARPPQTEALLLERKKLLTKSKLTVADKKRLEELEEIAEELPFGETKQERQERDAIKKALDVLMKERKPAS